MSAESKSACMAFDAMRILMGGKPKQYSAADIGRFFTALAESYPCPDRKDGQAMSKPDDIPQKVWDEAVETVREWPGNKPIGELVARAILAERERCASGARALLRLWKCLSPIAIAGSLASCALERTLPKPSAREPPDMNRALFSIAYAISSNAVIGIAATVIAMIALVVWGGR